jgi:hypothetical protein
MDRSDNKIKIAGYTAGLLAAVGVGKFDLAMNLGALRTTVVKRARTIDADHRSASRSYFLREDLMFPVDSSYFKVMEQGNPGGYWQLVRTNKATFDYIMSKVCISFSPAAWCLWGFSSTSLYLPFPPCPRPVFTRMHSPPQTYTLFPCPTSFPSLQLPQVDLDSAAWREGFTDGEKRKRRRGRLNMLDARGVIALALAWLGSTGPNNRLLELIFGVGHSVEDRDIREGVRLLYEALLKIPEAAILWPTLAEMLKYDDMFEAAHGPNPYKGHVAFIGALDCCRLGLKNSGDDKTQNADYNGWIKKVNKNACFAVAPTGKFIAANIDNSGKSHDFRIAAGIYARLKNPRWTPIRAALFSDSAFASKYTNEIMAGRYTFRPPPEAVSDDPEERAEQKKQYERLQRKSRQLSEHANNTLEAVWRRLTTPLPLDDDWRVLIFTTCLMMHNLNASLVSGTNQSTTLYMEAYLRP